MDPTTAFGLFALVSRGYSFFQERNQRKQIEQLKTVAKTLISSIRILIFFQIVEIPILIFLILRK